MHLFLIVACSTTIWMPNMEQFLSLNWQQKRRIKAIGDMVGVWINSTIICQIAPTSPARLFGRETAGMPMTYPSINIPTSTVTVDIVEGYNLVELNKPNAPNGYQLLGCVGVPHSTTNNVAINAVANNGKLRVFNNTSKILNNIIFTGTWLLYKISK